MNSQKFWARAAIVVAVSPVLVGGWNMIDAVRGWNKYPLVVSISQGLMGIVVAMLGMMRLLERKTKSEITN